MPRVLFVDDDPIITRVYEMSLTKHGFEVQTAENGIAALKAMHVEAPDVVVLDLMMPRLSGADVLKLMREQPGLETVPVIVLSNAYMTGIATDAAKRGAQAGLLKVTCTPAILIETICQVLEKKEGQADSSGLLAIPQAEQSHPQASAETKAPAISGLVNGDQAWPGASNSIPSNAEHDTALHTQVRDQFLQNADATCAGLRAAFENFKVAPAGDSRKLRLQDFYRQLHFLSASAGLAECPRLVQFASAFEALVFRLMDEPARINGSLLHTITSGLEFVEVLFREAKQGKLGTNVGGSVLVVDDDPVSNRLVAWALTQAGLQARTTEDPAHGLKLLQAKKFDLVLLDVQMPGMDGFEFCRQARQLAGYSGTPVIYVTAHSNFETCAKSVLVGGTDVIGKPVLPMELAVKAVMHLLKTNMPGGH